MKFELLPVLELMADFYRQPLHPARFQAYLKLLQGDSKGDLQLPISGYNPMAKGHLLEKIESLQALDAEATLAALLADVVVEQAMETTIQVAFNLADDLKGGWTNRYATDFASKFELNALVERNFCTPYLWSSERYTPALLQERSLAAVFRTVYWKEHGRLRTLQDHLAQETYVCRKLGTSSPRKDTAALADFYQAHRASDDYNLLFCFFYGDTAAAALGYPVYGLGEATGFDLAANEAAAGR